MGRMSLGEKTAQVARRSVSEDSPFVQTTTSQFPNLMTYPPELELLVWTTSPVAALPFPLTCLRISRVIQSLHLPCKGDLWYILLLRGPLQYFGAPIPPQFTC